MAASPSYQEFQLLFLTWALSRTIVSVMFFVTQGWCTGTLSWIRQDPVLASAIQGLPRVTGLLMWSAIGRYRQIPTCLGVISKYITQGWGRLNFNGFIFGEAGNRSLSDKPNGPDRHLCQMRGPVLSCDHSGDKLRNRATLGRVPDHMRHTGDLQLCANTRHVLFQAWTSLNDSRCQGQGRLYTLTI